MVEHVGNKMRSTALRFFEMREKGTNRRRFLAAGGAPGLVTVRGLALIVASAQSAANSDLKKLGACLDSA
jgi:hypothetical protein